MDINCAELEGSTKKVLEAALMDASALRAAEPKMALVARKTSGRLWLVDYLSKVSLSVDAWSFLEYNMLLPAEKLAGKEQNLGGFVLSTGSLSAAIRKAGESVARAKLIGEDSLADYFDTVRFSLVLAKIATEKSRVISSAGGSPDQEFCSLCWRLVNKFNLLNFGQKEDYSSHYCAIHHPTIETGAYNNMRRAVIAAVKRRGTKEDNWSLSQLKQKQNSRRTSEEVLYRMTRSFAHSASSNSLREPVRHWRDRAGQVTVIAKDCYPYTYSVISCISVPRMDSWKDWFLEIVQALDSSGTDRERWRETEDLLGESRRSVKSHDSLIIGWPVLMNILRRHESVNNISILPRPRGPKKGSVEKNLDIRENLQAAVSSCRQKGRKVVWAQIAKELNVSRERVRVLAKELGLSRER